MDLEKIEKLVNIIEKVFHAGIQHPGGRNEDKDEPQGQRGSSGESRLQ